MDCIAADPPGIFRCQEGDDATDIVRLRQTLERLHAQRKVAAGVRLDEVRHIGLDHTGRDRVDADAAGTEQRCEMLHETVDGAFGCCVGRDRTDNATRRERRDENDAATLRQDRKQLLDEKEGARTLTANSLSKSSTVVSSMVADFELPHWRQGYRGDRRRYCG